METITLHNIDEWNAFAEANKDALLEIYASLTDAMTAACQGGITLGGGCAPDFFIVFVDSED